jgi:lysophospholipid acyltransferase (LPLAT)-like uncharacterized protein
MQKYFIPRIIYTYIKFLQLTCKITFTLPNKLIKSNFLFLSWHREGLLSTLAYQHFKPDGKGKAVISQHRDGLMIKSIASLLGVGAIAGSSTRGGIGALINSIKEIKNNTSDIAITPDGPKGPLFSIAPGVVMIAQKTKCKIYTSHCKASSKWELNSWDKYMIPKPFCKLHFHIKGPFDVNNMSMKDAKSRIKMHMSSFD